MTLKGLIFTPLFYLWNVSECLRYSWRLVGPRRSFLKCMRQYTGGIEWLERHVLGLTYEIQGTLPPGPALIAMKHQSAWETLKVHRIFPNPAIVLKQELMRIPLWGGYCELLEVIPIDRSAKGRAVSNMLEAAKRAAANGRHIVIFPQGTRVPPGEKRPYKGGIGRIYAATGLPIVPVALNSGLFWPKRLFRQRGGKITLRVLDPIPAGLELKEAMRILEERLEAASDALLPGVME